MTTFEPQTAAVFHVPAQSDVSFADAFAKRLGVDHVRHTRSVFASGEMVVSVPHDCPNRVFVVLSPTVYRSDALIELMLLVDALTREGVESITCVLQYLFYSRSNRVNRRGLPLGARVAISLLEGSPISRFAVFDLHAREVLGFFTKPVLSTSTLRLLSDSLPRSASEVVVSPDRGRYDECVDLSAMRDCAFDLLLKVRRDHSGDSELAAGARTDLRNRSVLLYDDEIWTGQTAEHVITALHAAGVAAVHYLTVYDFTSDDVRLRMLNELGVATFTTTNLALPAGADLHRNYRVLDASPLLIDRLRIAPAA